MNGDANLTACAHVFQEPGCHSVYGVGSSVKGALVGRALSELRNAALIIVPSREQLTAWQTDLSFFLPDTRLFDFPLVDRALFTTTARSLDRSARQMEVLTALRGGSDCIVVATIEEAAQYIVAPCRCRSGRPGPDYRKRI
jgi:transcription-repair coupling factor (superfamily II helicase)